MIEERLSLAAQMLPEPLCGFTQIKNKADLKKKSARYFVIRYRMAAVLISCLILLLGSTVLAATTQIRYSAWASHSNSFRDAERIAEKLDVVLPESLGESPFCNITTMHVVPEGTTYLEALITPAYRWYSLDYAVQETVFTDHAMSTVEKDAISVSVGSSEEALWRYVFSLDESGAWALENTLPETARTEEYNGITMQIGTTVQYDEDYENEIFAYHHRVIWVDSDRQVVFSLHKSSDSTAVDSDQFLLELIRIAKGIIDLNASSK